MRKSHVCPGCGWNLGKVRAPADPVYGLPIVVCPGCRYACVRRRHPLIASVGRGARMGWALARLGLEVFAILVLIGTSGSFIYSLRREFWAVGSSWATFPAQLVGIGRSAGMSAWLAGGGRSDLIVWGFVAVISGVWLRATLPHWRVWALWTAWLALLGVVMSLESVGDAIVALVDWAETDKFAYRGPGAAQWRDEIAGVLQTGVLSACGMPLGGLIVRLSPRYRAWRIGRMRSGVRKLRQA